MKKTSKTTNARRLRSSGSRVPLVKALSAIQRVLKNVGARWYLFGAQAAVVHGVPRNTDDIDVTVLLRGGTDELITRLPRYGFELRMTDPDFLQVTRVIPATHSASKWRVDFVIGGPGLEQHFLEGAQLRRVGAIDVPVIRAEHLIVLKTFAGRPKDLEDIRGVLRVQGPELDLGETRRLLQLLESEVSDSTLLPVLDRLVEENRLSTNNRPAKRRGGA